MCWYVMSEFGSIADLAKPKTPAPQTGGSDVATKKSSPLDSTPAQSVSAVQEKFQKKMAQVSTKQKEVDTMRYATSIGVPHIDLDNFPVSQKALQLVPKEKVIELQAVCFFYKPGEQLRVGAIDPTRPEAQAFLKELEEQTGANGAMYALSKKSLDKVIDMYARLPNVKAVTHDISIKEEDLGKVKADVKDFSSLQALLKKTNTTNLVTFLLGATLQLGASDLHVEAEESGIHVRLRLDGILHDAARLEQNVYKQLMARIKLVSGLKINITNKPQDGRFSIKLSTGDVDVRVSTMPTYYGESVVMRMLPQRREGLSLDKLGITGVAYNQLQIEIERPNGMIITTGPTGSGKTTSLYSMMGILNEPGVKIITLEDPVEYRMEGINQSQVDKKKGYTFAAGLKSILRQDPDICMVGEIRDLETAEIAIQAALTGHLILSTIHTNSAAGSIPRFLSMGVKPFLLAPSLNAVIGQRLVRKLVEKTKVPAKLSPENQARVDKIIDTMPPGVKEEVKKMPQNFFTSSVEGPDGYKGRLGIYEIMTMNKDLEQMILAGQVSEYEVEKQAIEKGMLKMVQDGLLKALQGVTSIEEVFRVIE
jgi:type IV pilus assembly protein PilB